MVYADTASMQESEEVTMIMEEIMDKSNVLVIGNSGVGKSTLINAVLGEDVAETSSGVKGTTSELHLYEKEGLPFRLIDTVGFEPSFIKRHAAIRAIKKWSTESAKEGKTDTQINVIWFCIDGTSRKLFRETIDSLSQATKMWPTVPVITVITKSYSVPDREQNIEMVNTAFASQKHRKNLRKVIPVVASIYRLNDVAFAAPDGIIELIEATIGLFPEGNQAAKEDIARFNLTRRRVTSQSAIFAATVSGVVVGAVPIAFPDATILGPLELGEVAAIAKIYGIGKNDESNEFFDTIVQAGTVSLAAKSAISVLKAIPGIGLGAAAVNAFIAGSIVAAIGEGSAYAFEQVYLGNKKLDDINWVRGVMENKLSNDFIEKTADALKQATAGMNKQKIVELILGLFTSGTAREK